MSAITYSEMSCGGCGNAPHMLRSVTAVADGRLLRIEATCVACRSVSRIEVEQRPRLGVRNEAGLGTLCSMAWPRIGPDEPAP